MVSNINHSHKNGLHEDSENKGLYNPNYEHDACGVGFIANINGRKTHDIVRNGIQILKNLEHRGAIGGDMKTGDGAGMLIQIPHAFFRKVLPFDLPDYSDYGVGFFFLPRDNENCELAKQLIERVAIEENFSILGWRNVPVNPESLGRQARDEMPSFWQLFLTSSASDKETDKKNRIDPDYLERKLYILRKCIEREARNSGFTRKDFYPVSLSSRKIVYKGMFVSTQFETFYPDITDTDFKSALAIVHQRYSTNTFPSWYLAHPYRFIAHNGEINTLKGNVNKITAREKTLSSELFGKDINKIFPIAENGMSDSAIFDNVLELLVMGGRSLKHSLMMMVPEAFGSRFHISQDKRAFFEYHAAIMEPWDGPASISFSDGIRVGALLDRNGLRPARYLITKSGLFILASEVGVLDIKAKDIQEKGRLAPGKMIMVDTEEGRVIKDNEIKSSVSRRKPYRHWLDKNRILLKGLLGAPKKLKVDQERLSLIQKAFGYTVEDLNRLILPMAENAQEPVGSMGNDTALAVLSEKPQILFNYFKQLFAQVTNPPIDPYRENLVMSLMSFVGKERNLLDETPEHCRQLKLSHPILTNDDMELLRTSRIKDFKVTTVPILFPASGHPGSMEHSLNRVCKETESAIDDGASLIILSDRGVTEENIAIPSLLAISGVHHYLVEKGKRHLAGLIIESGEPREVHHFATLIGYGASAINPYLAFETIISLKQKGYISKALTEEDAIDNYITAIKKGLLKTMSKMGISTIRSYRGAQTFEAIGLGKDLIEKYFKGTASVIGGIGIKNVEEERRKIHDTAYKAILPLYQKVQLSSGGIYNYRINETKHLFSPEAIVFLQRATRANDYRLFKKYTSLINDNARNLCTLRSLFKIKMERKIPLSKVESETSIMKRFVTSAMSFGSISKETHESIAIAMNRLGLRSNCGEGGEDEYRFNGRIDGTSLNSKIKQVASARFGVTSSYLVNAKELQIKISQGAKPGEGGQLPGHKVTEEIARVRHSTPGVMLISPPPHHDIYSIEDLAQLIYDLKHGNPDASVSVKLVSELGVGTVAAGVAKGKADTVLISGGDGGTGASPLSSIMHTGTPWEIGLSETHQVLLKSNLRDKIRIQTDGQIKTGRDIIIAALLGAEEFGFATTLLVTLGCVMMRKCHLNTCPVGVATQDPELRAFFNGKPEYVENFMRFLAREVREYLAGMGFEKFEEIIGRTDLIEIDSNANIKKTENLDFTKILYRPAESKSWKPKPFSLETKKYQLEKYPDLEILDKASYAIEKGKPVSFQMRIRNSHRATGASLSAEISKKYGSKGLPDDTVKIKFKGSAGQSFAAFLAKGITFELEGDANDYFCKGLSGGKVIVYPPKGSTFIPERNIITGNVNLFGATGGEVYINGMAGERFCVRNSGAIAVVEGVGDHACEYMTGGRVIVIGETGVNFAAGMSGGIAYVLDKNQLFDTRCNLEMVDVEHITDKEDEYFIRKYLENHVQYTKSRNAIEILNMWEEIFPLFVKVMPMDYRKVLKRLKENQNEESDRANVTEEVYA